LKEKDLLDGTDTDLDAVDDVDGDEVDELELLESVVAETDDE
jgi:hypothetical protein